MSAHRRDENAETRESQPSRQRGFTLTSSPPCTRFRSGLSAICHRVGELDREREKRGIGGEYKRASANTANVCFEHDYRTRASECFPRKAPDSGHAVGAVSGGVILRNYSLTARARILFRPSRDLTLFSTSFISLYFSLSNVHACLSCERRLCKGRSKLSTNTKHFLSAM